MSSDARVTKISSSQTLRLIDDLPVVLVSTLEHRAGERIIHA